MDVKEIFNAALNQKVEHLNDVISINQKTIESFKEQLEEREGTGAGKNGNLYLKGVIDGMEGLNSLLRKYNER